MPNQSTLWSRLGGMFRGHGGDGRLARSGNGNGSEPGTRSSASATGVAAVGSIEPAAEPPSESADSSFAPPRSMSSLLRWGRSNANAAQLRAGHQHIIELAGTIREHLAKQDSRAERLADSVERMAGAMQQLAETQQAQGRFVQTIAERAEKAGRHAAAISETLSRMPSSLQAQADALHSVARQMETGRDCNQKLTHSLDRFGQAVDALRSAGAAQVETLQRMHVDNREQKQSLADLLREQGRRFLIAIIVAAALGVGAIIVMGIVVARSAGG